MPSRMHRLTVSLALVMAAVVSAVSAVPSAAQYASRENRGEPGRFDYYVLVLSWSPTYCATVERQDREPQCDLRNGRPYAFVLHGLWPQYERGWPQDCRTRQRPFVPRETIDRMLDIMPSQRLVIHEYRRHGTCSGLSPDAYYSYARKLFEKVTVPPRYVRPDAPFFASPGDVRADFVSANPGLTEDMIAVSCNRHGARLREVRICFSREGEFRSCGYNEAPRRLCSQTRVYVPPVRVRATGEDRPLGAGKSETPPGRSPLPGPLDPPADRQGSSPQRF